MKPLIEELDGDLAALGRVGADVRKAVDEVRGEPGNRSFEGNLALRLQHLSGCIEDMAYRVSVHINGEVPSGPGGHKGLLERTAAEVPGKRRALWRAAAFDDLDKLLKFRHFIRSNYAAELDREKLLAVAEVALRVLPLAEQDVRSFRDDLAAAAQG